MIVLRYLFLFWRLLGLVVLIGLPLLFIAVCLFILF